MKPKTRKEIADEMETLPPAQQSVAFSILADLQKEVEGVSSREMQEAIMCAFVNGCEIMSSIANDTRINATPKDLQTGMEYVRKWIRPDAPAATFATIKT